MEIKTIETLILAINTCTKKHAASCYLNIMKNIEIPLNRWERHFKFREDRPARVLLFETNEYQLILSCWEKGQEGSIHDIDSEEVWIHPITGQFIEERYRVSKGNNKIEKVSSIVLNSQSYSYMQKSKTIYRYINSYEYRSVCLHLYSKPVVERREYDENTGRVHLVEQVFDKKVTEYENLRDSILQKVDYTTSALKYIQKLHPSRKEVSAEILFKGDEGINQSIHLAKDAELSKHQSKTPALLMCVIGEVLFQNENAVQETLKPGQYVHIAPNVQHWIYSVQDSYLILMK